MIRFLFESSPVSQCGYYDLGCLARFEDDWLDTKDLCEIAFKSNNLHKCVIFLTVGIQMPASKHLWVLWSQYLYMYIRQPIRLYYFDPGN